MTTRLPATSYNTTYIQSTPLGSLTSELRCPSSSTKPVSGQEANSRGIRKFIKTLLKNTSAYQSNARKVTNVRFQILKMTRRSRTVMPFIPGTKEAPEAPMVHISLDNASSGLSMPAKTRMNQRTTQVSPFQNRRQRCLKKLQKLDSHSNSLGCSSHLAHLDIDHYLYAV